MTVENPFGITGCTGRITKRRSRVFVKLGPVVGLRLRRDQIFIDKQTSIGGRRGHVRGVRHNDKSLDACHFIFEPRHATNEG